VRTGGALPAIVGTRLHAQVRTVVGSSAAAVLVSFIQPHGIAVTANPLAADLATRSVWLAGPMFFCSMVGILIALAQRGGDRLRQLELCEQSAPLFARERARATALVPCIAAGVAALAYWLGQFAAGFAAPPAFFILALAAVEASTLVALSATLRTGLGRWLYVGMAAATTVIAYVLAVYSDTLRPVPRALDHYPDSLGVAAELLFCAIIGFLALRQYGEALARFDPIPSE
jgi:uncharacterized ion transporter superfamily protein YfcC